MAAALNGIALQSLTRAYGGTFLTFSDYMRPAVRLAALMQLPAIYVWTHDSIGLGEDGPTHQPVEQLASLRNIPGLDVVRPGDANETSICWRTIIEHTSRPAGIVLSRQNIPVLDRGNATGYAAAEGAARGGYILAEAAGGTTRRRADRHWLGGAGGPRCPGPAPGRRHPGPRRLHAMRGMVRRPGPGLP